MAGRLTTNQWMGLGGKTAFERPLSLYECYDRRKLISIDQNLEYVDSGPTRARQRYLDHLSMPTTKLGKASLVLIPFDLSVYFTYKVRREITPTENTRIVTYSPSRFFTRVASCAGRIGDHMRLSLTSVPKV